ncbi:MAG: xanthine dehydrogenase family protein molybdopterin-binding subunit [Chloroflexi bacterium]|nr:MAG: xanthine dehydrogenase family protein molybdopterin-binding subunit [Chloroflexota bacterium]
MSAAIGQSIPRVDGRAKVTGAGRYSAEIALDNMAYAVLVGAHVPSGRISDINTSEAEQAKGVLAVLTYQNLGRVAAQPPLLPSLVGQAAPGETFFPLQDEVVHYAGQPVAIVIADTLERAQYAATLVRISYEEVPSTTILDQGRDHAYEPERIFGGLIPARQERGDVEAGLAEAAVRLDVTYRFAANHHNPIEPSATTAVWDGDRLTLYDSTQGITATQLTVAALLGLSPSRVRVITHFIGGGFGCKAMIWPHVTLAALAARHIGRPVKLALSREQMFSSCGHREEQQQQVVLGASREGHLTAFRHHKLSLTSPFDDWAEPSLGMSAQLYACPNYEGIYRELFGWQGRNPAPRSQRDGNWLIGSGMATAAYPVALFMPTQCARARLYADGSAVIQAGTQDFGMGMATVMTQVAADGLGIPLDRVRFEYGDTDLPNTSAAVGSAGAGMVSAAVHAAATALRDQVIAQAIADERSPLHNADPSSLVVSDGRMMLRDRPDSGETYGELLLRHRLQDTEALGSWTPPPLDTPYGLATFGAQFAEVAVDADLGLVRVRRLVGVFAPGRVLNPRTARSQLMGGMLWGLGQALLEATYMDSQRGRWANASLGEYLVAVNADAPDVEVDLVEVRDEVVNPLGVKGCGEIGQVGAAAAIANAVFHATGRRFHELPIRIEHLL